MKIALKSTRLGLRNSTTRLPFRYGSACLTRCPQAVLAATIEADGRVQQGYSGDCLPPGWFDKSPDKDFARQIDDMLAAIELGQQAFGELLSQPGELFPAWLAAGETVHRQAAERGLTPLLASFGTSMVERAILDAMARHASVSFAAAVRENLYGIDSGRFHSRLAGNAPRDWLPAEPVRSIYLRHTIGLADPLTAAEIPSEERLHDGFPQALEEYIEHSGIRYFKIKVSNGLDHDVARLKTIAALIEKHRGPDYRVTLDGNEQYKTAAQFDELMDTLRATPELEMLLENTLVIEQPLARQIALDAAHTSGIRELGRWRPVIIDESDGELESYQQAIELGYRGVSSKNCKGPIKSLLNAGLTWALNNRGTAPNYVMTGEDQCSVGIIPTQADLCLVATLGLEHVERNGHHYHPGLTYLPEAQRRAALAAHGDFYAEQHGIISPHPEGGKLNIGSLQCVGFGFAVEPDFDSMESPEEWEFASLGL